MCTSPNRTSTRVAFAAALVTANAHALLPSTALAGCAGSACRHTPSAPAVVDSAKEVAPDVIDVFTHAPGAAKPYSNASRSRCSTMLSPKTLERKGGGGGYRDCAHAANIACQAARSKNPSFTIFSC